MRQPEVGKVAPGPAEGPRRGRCSKSLTGLPIDAPPPSSGLPLVCPTGGVTNGRASVPRLAVAAPVFVLASAPLRSPETNGLGGPESAPWWLAPSSGMGAHAGLVVPHITRASRWAVLRHAQDAGFWDRYMCNPHADPNCLSASFGTYSRATLVFHSKGPETPMPCGSGRIRTPVLPGRHPGRAAAALQTQV